MAARGILLMWNKWGIQLLVLVSFTLQVFLLLVGGIRRRSSSTLLRITTWFAYLLADSTAIYTLGHLSVASRSREHQLVAFWAPFLLLHLGGPDNITAYSIEDNSLWLRHLQILTVQVLGAAYVIYKYMASSGTLLLASISMFVVGLIKYGERTWALKCGKISSIRSSIRYIDYKGVNPCLSLREDMTEEDILSLAHFNFTICTCVFTDFPVFVPRKKEPSPINSVIMNQYKMVEMELSLMYDILYTKAAVIHTWYGFCIHFISLIGSATTFLLFKITVSGRTNGYSREDVIVSYILLVGALVLEAISVCRALLSSWTRFALHRRGQGWEWLLHILAFLGRHVQPTSKRLWAGSIGQYNLFHVCTRDRDNLVSRLVKKVGIEGWWNKLHFSGTFSPTSSLSIQDFMELVFRAVPELSQNWSLVRHWDPNGRSILKERRVLESVSQVYFGVDFNESILIWHIVTEVYIRSIAKDKHEEEVTGATKVDHKQQLIEATEVLSNYMMYLMVVKSDILPDPKPQKAHHDICMYMDHRWCSPVDGTSSSAIGRSQSIASEDNGSLSATGGSQAIASEDNGSLSAAGGSQSIASEDNGSFADKDDAAVASYRNWNPYCMLKEQFGKLKDFFHPEGPIGCRIPERKVLAEMLDNIWKPNSDPALRFIEIPEKDLKSSYHERVLRFAADQIVKGLRSEVRDEYEALEILFAVWVELLLYAGDRCSRESHARHLSNGGEFLTILWLMMKHENFYGELYMGSKTLRPSAESTSSPRNVQV